MRPVGIIGIILIIVGAITLIYGGITYTSHKKLFKVGSVEASAKSYKTISFPPALGIVLVAGGVVLVAVNAKKT